jgi:hypothetical protein
LRKTRKSTSRSRKAKASSEETYEQAMRRALGRKPFLRGAGRYLTREEAQGASAADAAERLSGFGKRHGLSLGGLKVKDLINEGRR